MSFTWQKRGLLFNPAEGYQQPWLQEFAQAPHVVQLEDCIRVYFSCRPPANSEGQYVSYSAYVELNKDNFFDVLRVAQQPILQLGKKGTFDEFGTYPVSVIKVHNEYRCYYAGWTRCDSVPFNTAIGMAISKDNGKTFERLGDGPILSYSLNEPFILSGPKIRFFNNKYYLFYIAGTKWVMANSKPEPVYQIRLAISDDGINFIKHDKVLIAPRIEENEAQASPDVFFRNGKYHMFFCYRYSANFRGKTGGYRIGYAVSENLVDWQRQDDKAGIDVSIEGWDSEMISYPHVFELHGKTYMLYLGNGVGKQGFGLAELQGEL
jgi:hypothetical protein